MRCYSLERQAEAYKVTVNKTHKYTITKTDTRWRLPTHSRTHFEHITIVAKSSLTPTSYERRETLKINITSRK